VNNFELFSKVTNAIVTFQLRLLILCPFAYKLPHYLATSVSSMLIFSKTWCAQVGLILIAIVFALSLQVLLRVAVQLKVKYHSPERLHFCQTRFSFPHLRTNKNIYKIDLETNVSAFVCPWWMLQWIRCYQFDRNVAKAFALFCTWN